MKIDGSEKEKLTENNYYDRKPRVLPDGKKIIFISNRTGGDEIYIMDNNGQNQTTLTNIGFNEIIGTPHLSSTGSKMIFTLYNSGIYTINTDGSNQTCLTSLPNDSWPEFSPDGKKVVFVSDRDGNPDIYMMDSDGENQINLTNSDSYEWGPKISPDGQKIVFINADYQSGGTSENIHIMNLNGTNRKYLTQSVNYNWDPQFSRFGTEILFQTNRDINSEIYIMDINGKNQINLTRNSASDYNAIYQPLIP